MKVFLDFETKSDADMRVNPDQIIVSTSGPKDTGEHTMWKIRIANYGTFNFHGTESQAEDMRKRKCSWEGSTGIKWRADLSRESDKLGAEIAALFDADKGCPGALFNRRRNALRKDRIAMCTGKGETDAESRALFILKLAVQMSDVIIALTADESLLDRTKERLDAIDTKLTNTIRELEKNAESRALFILKLAVQMSDVIIALTADESLLDRTKERLDAIDTKLTNTIRELEKKLGLRQ